MAAVTDKPSAQRTERAARWPMTRLGASQLLAVLGLGLVTWGLAWGLAPWVAIVVLGVLLLAAAFLVGSPPRSGRKAKP